MEYIIKLFTTQSTASTLIFLCITAVTGILIGKIEVKKIKLGIAGVLFTGLFFAHIGATIDEHIIHFIREFGLILFVYSIGIDVGPRFVSSFKSAGIKLNIMASMIVVGGFGIALAIYYLSGLPSSVVTGILCGAVTNTPSLGAAQQVLADQGGNAAQSAELTGMAYAVAYPFGILGIIITMLMVKYFFRIKIEKEIDAYKQVYQNAEDKLETITVVLNNPVVFGKKVSFIRKNLHKEFAISRITREGVDFIAREDTILQQNDIITGASAAKWIDDISLKLGPVEIVGKKEISGDNAMAHILVTSRKLAGKTIGQIGISRRYEANITRIFRAGGQEILPSMDTPVEIGDTLRVVGKKDIMNQIKAELGNSVRELAVPNTVPVFLGIFLGIIVGSIPFFIPGLPAPAKLGLAGGPLLIAILLGHYGRIGKFDFYMTPGANLMIRELGIVIFLSCVGLLSGHKFVETIVNGGYMWMVYGAIITLVPIMIVATIARFLKFNYLTICGMISGSMTDPPALEFANAIAPVQAQATAYATVYPVTMFLRILLAQVLVLLTL